MGGHESTKGRILTSAGPRACVMGHPVSHSRSPMIHGYWLERMGIPGRYELVDRPLEQFAEFFTHLAAHGYVGGNVTIPHKEAAYRLVHRRDAVAEAVGAVNTVWFEGDALTGGNSDPHGFIANLDDLAPGWNVPRCHAVVLGAGGAARSAAYALLGRGADVSLANRRVDRARELAAHFGTHVHAYGYGALPALLADADVLVNCTPLGMIGEPPLEVDLGPLKPRAVVCDVVYVPLETPLLAAARARGHRTVDGLGMLLHQAGFGFEKWFGALPQVTPDLRAMIEADIRAKTAAPIPAES
jgi:shikimate dehydrogenase